MTTAVTETQPAEKKWKFESEDGSVTIFPYLNAPEAIFPEDVLVSLYVNLKRDNLIQTTFPGMTNFNLPRFVSYFADKAILIGCVKNPPGSETEYSIIGFAWVWGIEGQEGARKAYCGYVTFKRFWGTTEIRQISRLALHYWFEESKIDVIFGSAMKTNVRAQRYDKEMGFKFVAELPSFFSQNGKLHDAVLVALKKEDFHAKEGVL